MYPCKALAGMLTFVLVFTKRQLDWIRLLVGVDSVLLTVKVVMTLWNMMARLLLNLELVGIIGVMVSIPLSLAKTAVAGH